MAKTLQKPNKSGGIFADLMPQQPTTRPGGIFADLLQGGVNILSPGVIESPDTDAPIVASPTVDPQMLSRVSSALAEPQAQEPGRDVRMGATKAGQYTPGGLAIVPPKGKQRPPLVERTAKQYANEAALNMAEQSRPDAGTVEAVTWMTSSKMEKIFEEMDANPGLWNRIKQAPKLWWAMTSSYYGPKDKARQQVAKAELETKRPSVAFDVPQAETSAEKAVDIGAGLGAFISQILVARKIVPAGTVLPDAVAWEMVNRANGGVPGQGAMTRGALGGIGAIPTGTAAGKIAKTGAESGLFAGLTGVMGGDAEDMIVSALVPVAFNTYNFARMRSSLIKQEKGLRSAATQKYQKSRREGMTEVVARKHLEIDMRAIDKAVARAKQTIYNTDAFAPAGDRWRAEQRRLLKIVATGKPGSAKVKRAQGILDWMTEAVPPGTEAPEGLKLPTTRAGEIAASAKEVVTKKGTKPTKPLSAEQLGIEAGQRQAKGPDILVAKGVTPMAGVSKKADIAPESTQAKEATEVTQESLTKGLSRAFGIETETPKADVTPEKRAEAINRVKDILSKDQFKELDDDAKYDSARKMLGKYGIEATKEEIIGSEAQTTEEAAAGRVVEDKTTGAVSEASETGVDEAVGEKVDVRRIGGERTVSDAVRELGEAQLGISKAIDAHGYGGITEKEQHPDVVKARRVIEQKSNALYDALEPKYKIGDIVTYQSFAPAGSYNVARRQPDGTFTETPSEESTGKPKQGKLVQARFDTSQAADNILRIGMPSTFALQNVEIETSSGVREQIYPSDLVNGETFSDTIRINPTEVLRDIVAESKGVSQKGVVSTTKKAIKSTPATKPVAEKKPAKASDKGKAPAEAKPGEKKGEAKEPTVAATKAEKGKVHPDSIREGLIKKHGQEAWDEAFYRLAEEGKNERFTELDEKLIDLDQAGKFNSPEALNLRREYETLIGDEIKLLPATKKETPSEAKEQARTESEPGAEVHEREAVDLTPTGKLDPTKEEDALKIVELHRQEIRGRESAHGGVTEEIPREGGGTEEVVMYSTEEVDQAYRTVQKQVDSPLRDTNLFAMPGKESQMEAIGKKMERLAKKPTFPAKRRGVSIPRPKNLPRVAKDRAEIIKAVAIAKASEQSRYASNGLYVDGDNLVATDGRRLFIAKGKWGKDGLYMSPNLKTGKLGKADTEGLKFPPYKNVIPTDYSDSDAIEIRDLDVVWRRLRKADIISSAKDMPGVLIVLNSDGTLGFAADASEVGHVEINVREGAKILGGMDPQFLMDVLAFHARRGDKQIEMWFPVPDRPILTRSPHDKTLTVTMPVNAGDASESLAETIDPAKKTQRLKAEAEAKAKKESEAAKSPVEAKKPATKKPRGKAAGATTIIPDLAAEVHGIVSKTYKNPVKMSKSLYGLYRRNLRRATNYMRTLGGAGEKLADDIDQITYRVTKNTNNDLQDIRNVFRGLSKNHRETVCKLINDRIPKNKAPKNLVERADKIRAILDRAMNDAADLDMKRTVRGEKIPVGGSGKAYPQVPNAKGVAFLEEAASAGKGSATVFAWANEQVQGGKFEDVDAAITALQRFRDNRMRGLNTYLESERVELPEDMIEWDGIHTLPHLIERNWMTVEGVRQWGNNFGRAHSRIETIKNQRGTDDAYRVKLFIETSFGIKSIASQFSKEVSRQVRGYQFITKVGLSPLTIMRNMFDRIAKGFTISPLSTIKASIKYPPFINQFIRSAQKHEDWMIRSGAVFGHGSLSEGYEAGSVITELASAPFSSSERGNQVFIAMVQYDKFLRDLSRLKGRDKVLARLMKPASWIWGSSERALKYRISEAAGEKALEKALAGEEMTQEEIEFMLHKTVRDKAFPMVLSTKPIWYDNHPFVKMLAQFKTWPMSQLNMIWRDVAKYTVKAHDPSRLIGFLIGTLIAGELYNILRDFLFDKKESLLSQYVKDEKEREVALAIVNDLLDGGVVGMLADFSYGIYDWVTGVSARTAKNTWDTALHIKKRPSLTFHALERLAEKELTPYRQVKRLADKVDRKWFNENNISKAHYKWRAESWKYREGKKNPTAMDKVGAYADRVMMGTQDYGVGENTLAYELAARQVIVGDVRDAAKYLRIILRDADDRAAAIRSIRSSKTSRSPLGKVAQKDRSKFLKDYSLESKREAMAVQNKYLRNYERALRLAAKNR